MIQTPKGYYEVHTFMPSQNGPEPVKGKVFTHGEAPSRYVLLEFIQGKGYIENRDEALNWCYIDNRERALNWMRRYHDESDIKWVEYEPTLPGFAEPK